MNTKKIKRIIAREGLIIISLLAFYFINNWLGIIVNTETNRDLDGVIHKMCWWDLPDKGLTLNNIWYQLTQFSLYVAYPLYWLIRFIIWAVRILRVKE